MIMLLGIYPILHLSLVCYDETFLRETGLIGRAGVIGLIRQGFVGVGLEADQRDCDRVSSDQGFLIGRSGCEKVR